MSTTSSSSTSTINLSAIPFRVTVKEVRSARYSSPEDKAEVAQSQWYTPGLIRPLSWDDRREGVDTILLENNEELRLVSSGMQSVPQPGWSLLITGGDPQNGYTWTLYGIKST